MHEKAEDIRDAGDIDGRRMNEGVRLAYAKKLVTDLGAELIAAGDALDGVARAAGDDLRKAKLEERALPLVKVVVRAFERIGGE